MTIQYALIGIITPLLNKPLTKIINELFESGVSDPFGGQLIMMDVGKGDNRLTRCE